MTNYQVSEQDLIDISECLIEANNIIYGHTDFKQADWDTYFTSIETTIENIFKNNKLYKASLV